MRNAELRGNLAREMMNATKAVIRGLCDWNGPMSDAADLGDSLAKAEILLESLQRLCASADADFFAGLGDEGSDY